MSEEDKPASSHPHQPKFGSFSSFNPTSYYASHRQQSFNLQHAADQLLSSSSDDNSTSSASSQQEHTTTQEPQDKKKKKKKRSKSIKKHKNSEKKKERRKKRKRRKHEEEEEEEEERQEKHHHPHGTDLFFIDTQGDDANIQFQGLYRGDIATYNRHNPTKSTDHHHQQQQQEIEIEIDREDNVKVVMEEKAHQAPVKKESKEEYVIRKTREYNISLREQPHNVALWLEFAEFQEEAITSASSGGGGGKRKGSSSNNNSSSSRVSLSMRKAIAEKKLAILEKALQLQQQRHGGDDAGDDKGEEVLLLLALLKTAAVLVPEHELNNRWLTALSHYPQSHTLWLAYLQFYQCRAVTGFSALAVVSMYARATETLTAQRHADKKKDGDDQHAVVETGIVAVLLQGCRFLFSAGYNEMAVAVIQAVLEFNFLSPQGWPEDALVMMFEEMWNDTNGSTYCIGQEGALGWGTWLDRQINDSTHKEKVENIASNDNDKKGEKIHQPSPTQTSAWVDVIIPTPRRHDDDDDDDEEEKEEEEKEEKEKEEEEHSDNDEKEDALLKVLQEELEAKLQKATSKLTRETLQEWLSMEQQRSNDHWLPEHHTTINTSNDDDHKGEVDDRNTVVTFQHIKHALIKFESSTARRQLLTGCLQLLNATIPNNSSNNNVVIGTLLCMPSNGTISTALSATAHELHHLGISSPVLGSSNSGNNSGNGDWVSEALKVGEEVVWEDVAASSEWYWPHHHHHHHQDKDKRAFVINMLTLLIKKVDFNSDDDASLLPILITSLYQAQHGSEHGGAVNTISSSSAAAIELCKAKLEAQSNTSTSSSTTTTMWLWHVYAQMESMRSNNWKMARKIYNTCLSSYNTTTTTSSIANLAPIVLGAATMELKQSSISKKNKNKSSKSKGNDSSDTKFDDFSVPSLKLILEASAEALHAAVHPLTWYGRLANSSSEPSGGEVTTTATMQYHPRTTKSVPSPPPVVLLYDEHIIAARRGYQSLLLSLLNNNNNNNNNNKDADDEKKQPYSTYTNMMACISSYVSFELFIGRLTHNLGGAIKAALSLYDSAISLSIASGLTESLYICKCTLAVEAAACTPPLVTPKVVTDMLSDAIITSRHNNNNNCHGSIPLLRLLAVHGVVGGGLKSAVRRVFYNVCSGKEASLAGWLMYAVFEAAAAAAAAATGKAAMAARTVIEKATSSVSSSSSSSPLLWKCRLALESKESGGLWNDRQKKVLLMGVSACPGNKALWMQGMRAFCQVREGEREVDVGEAQGWLEVMKSRDLKMRSDLLEAVFAMLEKEGGVE